MITSCSILVLFAAFQVISGQPPPERPVLFGEDPRTRPMLDPILEKIPRSCWRPPIGVNPFECCKLPRFYADEVLLFCGIEKPPEDKTKLPPPTPDYECKRGRCLMNITGLLNDDESIDFEKLRDYIDYWGKTHPNHTEAIERAKNYCIKGNRIKGSDYVCDYDKIIICLTSNMLWNCDLREDLEQCIILRNHMDECRPFYFKETEKPIESKSQ